MITDVFLNQKRANVCEHTVRTMPRDGFGRVPFIRRSHHFLVRFSSFLNYCCVISTFLSTWFYQKNEQFSRWKIRIKEHMKNLDISNFTEVFVNQKRVNVCEQTVWNAIFWLIKTSMSDEMSQFPGCSFICSFI